MGSGAIACEESRDVANALRTYRMFARLDPWNSAFKARWGVPLFDGRNGAVIDVDVELRDSVGKMAYLLRHLCELVSGNSALAKARHTLCNHAMCHAAIERFQCMVSAKGRSFYYAEMPKDARRFALQQCYSTLSDYETSKLSRRALYEALKNGLYFLVDRTSQTPQVPRTTRCMEMVKRFVAITSFTWKFHATVIGVADEPFMAEAMRGSHGQHGHQLLAWFDGLLLGADPHVLIDPTPSPPRNCGAICLADCEVSMSPGLSQRIEPPPSPATVSSLIDSLGLGKMVHPDDLLLALLLICDIVPGGGQVWRAAPGQDSYEMTKEMMYKGYFLWARGGNGRPTRMTWANGWANGAQPEAVDQAANDSTSSEDTYDSSFQYVQTPDMDAD
ncbi:hypothetical protein T492DRAFT_898841 [Pavlovales sp. CCMP2436]|nr:hypothetical protein T492DRAFT_898841 [Pavlovales sp. CCMP2436]